MDDWFSLGTKNGVIKDREGKYLINVGYKSFHIDSGWVQTGIAYPYSWNASDGIPCSPINVDGSVIEFVGTDVDFPANEYRLKEVIVLNSN